MEVRKANPQDAESITYLLNQLGYPGTEDFITQRINMLAAHPDEDLVVGIENEKIVAVLSIHFIPQLALHGSFARISYFCVDNSFRCKGIGLEMGEYCERVARERGCDRIEVHCHERRERALGFYRREGYQESPKYLVKKLR